MLSRESLVAELALLKQAFSEAKEFQTVLDVRAQAVELIASARRAFDLRQEIAEIKLRAERLASRLFADLKLHGGDHKSEHWDSSNTLESHGVSRQDLSRWRKGNSLPDKDFEEWLVERKTAHLEITSNALRKAARRFNSKQSNHDCHMLKNHVVNELHDLQQSNSVFGGILITPPLNADEYLSDLPIIALAADRSHVHILSRQDQIARRCRLLETWGFEYVSVLMCHLAAGGFTSYFPDVNLYLLVGARNDLRFRGTVQINGFEFKKHPPETDRLRDIIETLSPPPLLHIFSEEDARGWSCVSIRGESTGKLTSSSKKNTGQGNSAIPPRERIKRPRA